jgi:hypothetical protein
VFLNSASKLLNSSKLGFEFSSICGYSFPVSQNTRIRCSIKSVAMLCVVRDLNADTGAKVISMRYATKCCYQRIREYRNGSLTAYGYHVDMSTPEVV